VVLLQETGRSLFPSPLLSTTLAAAAVLDQGTPEQQQRWLPSLADGTRIGTLAFLEASDSLAPTAIALLGKPDGDAFVLCGEKKFVADAGSANLFVVAFRTGGGAGDLALAVLDAGSPGVTAAGFPTIDATKRLGTLVLENARVPKSALLGAPGHAGPAFERLCDLGAVAVTAELTGAADQALAITTQYAKGAAPVRSPDREVPGREASAGRDVRRPRVDEVPPLLRGLGGGREPRQLSRSASLAKAYGSDAFTRIGIDGVQLHGAVGHPRSTTFSSTSSARSGREPAFGDSSYHYDARRAPRRTVMDFRLSRRRGLPQRGARVPRRQPAGDREPQRSALHRRVEQEGAREALGRLLLAQGSGLW
jgi:acyl-CoA dehydrogenase